MEFRLVYQGPLAANGSVRDKHNLRKSLHPQLATLWQQVPLSEMRPFLLGPPQTPGHDVVPASLGWAPAAPPSVIVPLDAFTFSPLVSTRLRLVCHLDILFLRPEQPGSIITTGGDIDNRLKTLLDALRIPKTSSELPPGASPAPDETPFFCLLEDDALVTQIRVTTDRLLAPVQHDTHVYLILAAAIKAARVTFQNIHLTG